MNPDFLSKTSVKGVYDYDGVCFDYNFFKSIEDELFEYQINHPEEYLPFHSFWSKEHNQYFDYEWSITDPQAEAAMDYHWKINNYVFYEDILNDLFKDHPEWSGIIYKGVVPEEAYHSKIVPTKKYGIYAYTGLYVEDIYFDFNYFQEVEEDIFQDQMMNTSMIFPVKGFWTEEHYKKIFHNPKFTKAHDEWKHLANIEDGIFTLYKEFIKEYPQYEKLFIKSEEDLTYRQENEPW